MRRTNRSVDGGSGARDADASGRQASLAGGDRIVADGGRDGSGSDAGQHRPDETDREAERRRKRRAAVRPHESGIEPGDSGGEPGGDPRSSDQWAPPGMDPDDVPSYFPPVSVDDPDPPPIVDRLGSVGIYLALGAMGLAVVGVGAAAVGVQPFGNAAITLSLGLGLVAMLFGMVFQAVASDFLSRSE